MKFRYKLAIVIFIIGIYFIPPIRIYVNRLFFIFSMADVTLIREYILSFGIIAPLISFLLMIFQSVVFPLPAFLITFANASIFGFFYGFLLSYLSSMAGAAVCFYISRFLGREQAEKLTSKRALKDIDGFFTKHGKYAVLIARLLPFMSFDIVSYAAGLTGISFWAFFLATGIGQVPAAFVYSYVGGMLTGGTKMFVTALLTIFALLVFVFLLKRLYEDKMQKTQCKMEDK